MVLVLKTLKAFHYTPKQAFYVHYKAIKLLNQGNEPPFPLSWSRGRTFGKYILIMDKTLPRKLGH